MALTRVPAEILGLCLREAHSPEDVGAALRASPAFLNAFQCQEEAVLRPVLKRCMSGKALYRAVLVTICPIWEHVDKGRFNNLGGEASSEDDDGESIWEDKMRLFDMTYRLSDCLPDDLYLTARILKAVCRLRANVNRIIADYVEFTESVSDIHGPEPAMYAPNMDAIESLSEEELGRLQSAFLQYELFCRSCGWAYFHSWVERLDEVYLCDSYIWGNGLAKEEVIVVHRYVMAKYTAMFQEIVESFTATINSISKAEGAPHADSNHPSVRELLGDDGPRFLLEIGWRSTPSGTFSTDDWRSLPLGWGQGYVTICADNFSRLGLGFLMNMLGSNRQSRRDLIRDVFDIFCPREESWFPPKASNFVWTAEDVVDYEFSKYEQEAMENNGNSAWKELLRLLAPVKTNDYVKYDDIERLRKQGWIFWDDKRLSDLEIAHPRRDTAGDDDLRGSHRMELTRQVSVQQLYGERRLRAPILTVLRKRISRESWAEKIVPQFYTKPHPGFRKANMRTGPCESSERLMEIVDLAQEVALDRRQ